MKKETLHAIIGGLVIVLVGVGIYFLVNNGVKKETPKDYVSSTMKDSFMTGCVSPEASYSFCNCAYDTLEKKLGVEGMISLSSYYDTNKVLPAGTVETISSCIQDELEKTN